MKEISFFENKEDIGLGKNLMWYIVESLTYPKNLTGYSASVSSGRESAWLEAVNGLIQYAIDEDWVMVKQYMPHILENLENRMQKLKTTFPNNTPQLSFDKTKAVHTKTLEQLTEMKETLSQTIQENEISATAVSDYSFSY